MVVCSSAHFGANYRAFAKPLLGLEECIVVVHAFIQHGQVNGGDGFARNTAQPIIARGNMAAKFWQLAAPSGMTG